MVSLGPPLGGQNYGRDEESINGVLVFSDWIAASKTNIYALGCVQKEDQITTPWTNRGNLVPNGNMEIVNGLPGQVRSGTLATVSFAVSNQAFVKTGLEHFKAR